LPIGQTHKLLKALTMECFASNEVCSRMIKFSTWVLTTDKFPKDHDRESLHKYHLKGKTERKGVPNIITFARDRNKCKKLIIKSYNIMKHESSPSLKPAPFPISWLVLSTTVSLLIPFPTRSLHRPKVYIQALQLTTTTVLRRFFTSNPNPKPQQKHDRE